MKEGGIPKWGLRLLAWLLPYERQDILIGDFIECYQHKQANGGKLKARWWFWRQIMASFPAFIRYRTYLGTGMFKSYLTLAFRNLYKQAAYSLLNLSGLALGIACFVVIMLYVNHERSYDQFHPQADRTYRLLDFRKVDGIGEESASAPTPLAEAMRSDYPEEIESIVRFFNFQAPTLALAHTNEAGELKQFNERKLYFTDAAIFEVFGFQLAAGDPKTALLEPNSIVLTQETAQKYFGTSDPLGKILRFEDKHDLVVTGILEPLLTNTHLDFDFLASFATLMNPEVLSDRLRTSWIWNPSWTYMVLSEGVSAAQMENQFRDFVVKYWPESSHEKVKLYLQPVADIHLDSRLDYEMHANSDGMYVYVFITIAVFILLISCFNFINLTTARSTRRAREIGMRKIFGGHKRQLISQFLSESIITCLVALVLSFPLIWLQLQFLRGFSGKDLVFDPGAQPQLMLGLVGLAVLIGLISGLYPAFFLSSYRPVQAVKGSRFVEVSKGVIFRKLLVVGQFSLSIVLIVGTMIAIKQLRFLENQRLGFDQEKVLLLPTLRSPLMEKYQSFKQTLLQNENIHALTTVEDIPGMKTQTGGYKPEGYTEVRQFPRLVVHDDFAKTMGIPMAAGRGFDYDFKNDTEDAIVINEAMVRALDWGSAEAAIGKRIDDRMVVGVMEDFHFVSLHRPIEPFLISRVANRASSMAFSSRYIAIRIDTDNAQETLSFIEDQWFQFTPNRPFEYLFLSDLLGTQYEVESVISKVAGAFAGLSVLIACLGLFGLASFTAERRIKEIGIRKVLGAPVLQLVGMLVGSFMKLVLISILIGSPLAYLALNGWLGDFAYRTEIGVWPFLGSAGVAVVIVLLTVGYQTIKAASTNPVKSLRYE